MRSMKYVKEVWLTLIAWVQGRRGVLDDLGNLIESDAEATEYPFELSEPSSINSDDTDGEVPENIFETHKRGWVDRLKSILPALLYLVCFAIFLRWSWMITGWIGNKVFNIPGAVGNLAGFVAVLGVFVLVFIASTRYDNARAFRRASRGIRDVNDRLSIYSCLQLYKVCPACAFSLQNHIDESAKSIRCSECGAQWIPRHWVGFLARDRTGEHKDLKRKSARRASCLVDARDQMYVVLAEKPLRDRKRQIQSTPTPGVWKSQVLVVMCFLPLIGGVMGIMLWVIGLSKGTQSLVIGAVFAVILILVMLIVFRTYLDTARTRRIKQLGCDMIDRRQCGCCGGELDGTPHVVDGALVCVECGLFFDPQTANHSHHCRKRIPWDRFKSDPVFERNT